MAIMSGSVLDLISSFNSLILSCVSVSALVYQMFVRPDVFPCTVDPCFLSLFALILLLTLFSLENIFILLTEVPAW